MGECEATLSGAGAGAASELELHGVSSEVLQSLQPLSSGISGKSIHLTSRFCPLALLLLSIYPWAVFQFEVDKARACVLI